MIYAVVIYASLVLGAAALLLSALAYIKIRDWIERFEGNVSAEEGLSRRVARNARGQFAKAQK